MTSENAIGIQVSKQLEISLTKSSNALLTDIETFFIEKHFKIHFFLLQKISILVHNSKTGFNFNSKRKLNSKAKVKRVTLLVSFPRPAQKQFFS
jgi:hypothetical protein